MALPLSSIRLVLMSIPIAAALAGCQGREYYAQQLASIPMPQSALMKRISAPDCSVSAANLPKNIVLKSEKNGKTDSSRETNGKAKTSAEKANVADQLRWQRDCYRNAEKRARDRLHKLQASTAGVVGRMRNVKNDMRYPAARLHRPDIPVAGISQFEKRAAYPGDAIPSFRKGPES